LPDLADRFYKKYKDKGLKLVAIDPGGKGGIQGADYTDDIGGVQKFVKNLGVEFPVGLEDTTNYLSYAANYKGPNPFPVDIIVGKDGKIAYIAREYDPDAMTAMVEKLLAQ
jgi:hypothetical protein